VENVTARWEMEALTADVLAIAAAVAWLLAFGWCSVVTSRPAVRAGAADPGPGLASARPALVNLSVTQGRLNGAAYPATILDLAAHGYLTISERVPGQLWCEVPPFSPPGTGLARSERLVLTGAWALAGGRGAPFEALADSCASDVRGRWDPFERAVRGEGRRAGITRPRLPAAARLVLYAGAGVVGAAVFAGVYGRSHSGLWAPSAAAFFAFAVLASWARSVGRRDRLTAHGSALGAWAARAALDVAAAGGTPGLGPAELSRLAQAVAVGAPVQIPGAFPGLAARAGRSGQTNGTPRPSSAWSSLSGQWRLVRIGPASFMRIHPAFWLVLAAWLALMAYVSSLLPTPAGLLVPVGLAVGSAAAAVGGTRGLAARLARPAEATFQAQVIARWVEQAGANDDDYISCIAVDDGERSWSFDVTGKAFGQLALGDTVAIRASPRSGKLLGLTPDRDRALDAGPPAATIAGEPAASAGEPAAATGEPAAATGEPAAATGEPAAATAGDGAGAVPPGARWAQRNGPESAPPGGVLLSADEVSAAVGRPVRRAAFTPGAASVVYRGPGITVIVTVADGFLGSLTAMAQRRGQPLAGIGDGAWLLNRGRTAVLLVGGLTAKVTAGGSATRSLPPDAVTRLAATVAERLPHHAALPGGQA
jgi:hypothetical protein